MNHQLSMNPGLNGQVPSQQADHFKNAFQSLNPQALAALNAANPHASIAFAQGGQSHSHQMAQAQQMTIQQ